MMELKRLLAVMVCIVMAMTVMPSVTMAETDDTFEDNLLDIYSDEEPGVDEEMSYNTDAQSENDESVALMASNLKICGVDIGIAAGKRMSFNSSKNSTTYVSNGYYYKGVYLAASQCFGFARWCQYKIYGTISAGNVDSKYKSGSSNDFYKVDVNGTTSVAAGKLTTSNLKSFIQASKPGAHLRTNGSAHSMVITAITDKGFSIAQANGSNNDEYSGYQENYVGTHTYTWSNYVSSTYGARGIAYIEVAYKAAAKPAAPTISSHTNDSKTSATLKWGNATGAKKYELQYRQAGQDWAKDGITKTTTATSLKVTGLEEGKLYWFRLRAVNDMGKSGYSDNHGVYMQPKAPTTVTNSDSSITVKWASCGGTTKYELLSRKAGEDEYKSVKKGLTDTTYTHNGLEPGTLYYYKIKAYNQDDTSVISGRSDSGCGYTKPAAPKISSHTNDSKTSATLKWGKTTGASSYELQYRQAGQDWAKDGVIKTTTSTSLKVTDLEEGKLYWFRLRAVNDGGKSGYSENHGVYMQPKAPTAITNGQNSITVKWDFPGGATKYELLARKSGETDYTSIATNIDALSYVHTGLEPGSLYYYKIKAYNQDVSSVISERSEAGYGYTKSAPPTLVSKTPTSVTISWAPFQGNGTYKYYIYRNTTCIGETSETSYTDTTVEPNSSYDYYFSVERTGPVLDTTVTQIVTWADTLRVTTDVMPPDSIVLNTDSLTLVEGGKAVLTATVYPDNATDKNVTWQSSNDTVAYVDNGTVVAVSPGTAVITASTVNGKTASCNVTVSAAVVPLTGLALDRTTLELTEGESTTLTPIFTPQNATIKTIKWRSAAPDFVSVENGTVKALKAGEAYIYVDVEDGNGAWITAQCAVTVRAAVTAVSGITIDRTSLELKVGENTTLTAKVTPENATNKRVKWTSDNVEIATVKDGFVEAVRKGRTIIRATSVDGGFSVECTINVTETEQKAKKFADMTIGSVSGILGENVTVPISISNNPGIAGFKISIYFDRERLLPVSIEKGSILTDGTLTSNIQQGGDMTRFEYVTAYWVNPADFTDSGNILNVIFKVLENAPEGDAAITVTYSNGDVSNQKFEIVGLNITNGNVKVGKNALKGDVFTDGYVDTRDGVKLSQYLAEWETELSDYEKSAADIVTDGSVDTRDGVKLSQYLAEWDVELMETESTSLFEAGKVSFAVKSAESAGKYVDVPVEITKNSGMAGFKLKLNYDKTKLLPVSIEKGAALTDGTLTSNIQQGGDMARFDYVTAYWVNPANITTNGVAFTVRFEILEEAAGETPLSLTFVEGDICDQNYDLLDVSVSGGTVTIGGGGDQETANVYTINSLEGEMPTTGTFYAEVNVTKNEARSGKDVIVIALYVGDTLVDMTYMRAEFEKGQNVTFGGRLTAQSGAKLKTFVWDDMTGLEALSNTIEK